MTEETLNPKLWVPRSTAETLEIYADWASQYDADVTAMGYATPGRVAEALAKVTPLDAPILDFGCGTGLSGLALRAAGFSTVDGSDISPEMLALAEDKKAYRNLSQATPGETAAEPGTYAAIIATGVVSLGAAPPETLDALLAGLAPGAHTVFSFNDPTIAHGSYDAYLDGILAAGTARLIAREHGPHLPEKDMGSDVITLEKL